MDDALANPSWRFSFVDFHAEATAEKKALGFYLDGVALAHSSVPTPMWPQPMNRFCPMALGSSPMPE